LLPLQRFDLDQLNLLGIIWDISDPKAMFKDPNGEIHIVGLEERIGRKNGYIAVIREGEVVVVEASRRKGEVIYTSRVLRMEQ
ncbi:MAG: pilus assembly protein PilP, partial [Pseudomonadota bacterium]